MEEVYIPEEFFIEMKITKKASKWVDSEEVEQFENIDFKGAMFDLNMTEKKLLSDGGISLNDITKKIYCYIDIGLDSVINIEDENYKAIDGKTYGKYADLRVYYIKRVGRNGK